MKKLIIDNINNYDYYLKDEYEKLYKLNIEFYDLVDDIKIGDYIYMNEELFEEKNTLYSFGPLTGECGRKITSSTDKDIIVLISNDKEIYLKRYYG